MARPRSPVRKKAEKMWLDSGRTMKLKDIAAELGVSDVLIRKWKHEDKWDEIPIKRPRGAPPGNQNAKGNKGGGAPKGNQNALKHGLYRKLLPEEVRKIMKDVEVVDPLDMLWHGIEVAYAKMLWAQRIMFVRDKDDITKEVKKSKVSSFEEGEIEETEWQIQFAWDKQATDMKAFAVINKELRSAIKQFLAMAPENDARRMRLDLIQAQIDKANLVNEKLKLQVEEMGGKTSKRKLESFL